MAAAFSYQQPNTPIEMSSSCLQFPFYYPIDAMQEEAIDSSSLDSGSKALASENHSSVLLGTTHKPKIKNGQGTCLSSTTHHSKDTKESKKRKKRSFNGGMKETEEEEEAPKGYIHVRARRGQATDSHSLAERVRREKISERMKMLQDLVPGCDKVTGKAVMLDEIINYVQSLQNQVEFLSMKLASLNPMLYNFAVDFDHSYIISPDQLPLKTVNQQASQNVQLADHFEDTKNSYIMMMEASSSTPFSQENTGSSAQIMQVSEQRQGLLNHQALPNNNMAYI